MQKAMSFNDIAIVFVKESAYRIHFWYMRKDKYTFYIYQKRVNTTLMKNLIIKKTCDTKYSKR